jgi:hypothetical protein
MSRKPQEIVIFFVRISWEQGRFLIQVTSLRDVNITLLTVLSMSLIWSFLQVERNAWISIENNEPTLFLIAMVFVLGLTLFFITRLHRHVVKNRN